MSPNEQAKGESGTEKLLTESLRRTRLKREPVLIRVAQDIVIINRYNSNNVKPCCVRFICSMSGLGIRVTSTGESF